MGDIVAEVRKLIAEAMAVARPFPAILDVLSDEIVTQVKAAIVPHELVSIDAVTMENGGVTCRVRRREEIATPLERTGLYFTGPVSQTVRPPSFAALAALAALTHH